MKSLNASNEIQIDKTQKITKTEIAKELLRDFNAGVYEKFESLAEFARKLAYPKYGVSYDMLCKHKNFV